MRKRISKRRWIARFHLGKPVPYLVTMVWPDLKRRFAPCELSAHTDLIRKSAA